MKTLENAETALIQKTHNLDNQQLFERTAKLYGSVEESLVSFMGLLLALGPPELRARGSEGFIKATSEAARAEIVTQRLGEGALMKVKLAAWMGHSIRNPASYGMLLRIQNAQTYDPREGQLKTPKISDLTFTAHLGIYRPESLVVLRDGEPRIYNTHFLKDVATAENGRSVSELDVGQLIIAEGKASEFIKVAQADSNRLYAAVQNPELNPELQARYAENEPYVGGSAGIAA